MTKTTQPEIQPTAKGINEWLSKRPGAKVSTIQKELMTAIKRALSQGIHVDKNSVYNQAGHIIAIKCNAIERWCPLEGPKAVEFSDKHVSYSKSGKSNMCKEGYNEYFKKYRLFKKQKVDLAKKLELGEITREEYEKEFSFFEAAFKKPSELKLGFAEREDCIVYLQDEGLL